MIRPEISIVSPHIDCEFDLICLITGRFLNISNILTSFQKQVI